ncbi:hypothetical protein EK21DRAFT_93848 [Setomelanomma holmii]|uniref:Uncharacterized protein n=1 Tax=Setomelanomma holmii TaxID=210430 RepID=A0A9P4H0Z9_9PLEO|nr:hypothetical protein EK21DRAFT_93848 [Setomelanomma holmii]
MVTTQPLTLTQLAQTTNMACLTLPPPPKGVDPEVLAKINVFMNTTAPKPASKPPLKAQQRPALSRRGAGTRNVETKTHGIVDSLDQNEKCGLNASEEKDATDGVFNEIYKSPSRFYHRTLEAERFRCQSTTDKPTHNFDCDEYNEKSSLLFPLSSSTPSPNNALQRSKILARAIYTRPPRTSPPLPLPPRPVPTPSQRKIEPSALTTLLSLLYVFLMGLFVDDQPAIIEYSTAEIKSKVRVRCEAQLREVVVGRPRITVVMLHIDDENTEKTQVVPITAKPKRVRDLLKEGGVRDVAENLYGKEILGAMRMLSAQQRFGENRM